MLPSSFAHFGSSEPGLVEQHMLKHYVDSQRFCLVPEEKCLDLPLVLTRLILSQRSEARENEHFLSVELTYSAKKQCFDDSNDRWLLAVTRPTPVHFHEDALVIAITASRILPKLVPMKTIDIVRIDKFDNSYNKLKFHQKSFDLAKLFLTTNKKLRSFLVRNNFINLQRLHRFQAQLDHHISTSEKAPHLFGTFQSKRSLQKVSLGVPRQARLDVNAQKEHIFKDYKVKNVSACKFVFYVKLIGPFFFDPSAESQLSEFQIRQNEILSVRVYMKRIRQKHLIEWPSARESLLKGVMIISYRP